MTLSLPNVQEVRNRIESIPDKAIQVCYKTTYLMCARIGEIVSLKCPSDETAHPTGSLLEMHLTTYVPDLNNPKEFQTLMLARTMQGESTSIADIAKIQEPAAVFTVSTEKRQGWKRQIGLPLRYEPWAETVVSYFEDHGGKELFPFTRQDMFRVAEQAFEGLNYTIYPYKRRVLKDGEPVLDPDTGKALKDPVPEHSKPFRNQAIRHLRNVELRDFYGLTAEERSSYGGWTLRTLVGGISSSIDRYGEAVWRPYFPKLLKRRV